MEPYILLIVILLIVSNSFILWFFLRKPKDEGNSRDTLLLQQQIQDLTRTMRESSNTQFQESRELVQSINKEVNEQLRNVIRHVTEVSESTKQVFSVAEQLQNLENSLLKTCFRRLRTSFSISFPEETPSMRSYIPRMA